MTAPDSSTTTDSTVDGGDDDAAQQALAAALEASESNEDADDDDRWDEEAARKKFEKANREAKNLRDQLKALKPLAEEAEKRRKGEQTEAQRLTEQKAELEVQLAELRTSNVRRDAAEAAGLAPKWVKFITAADPDDALAQAKELAKELKPAEERERRAPDLRQGARGTNNAGATQSHDDLLRQMARQR